MTVTSEPIRLALTRNHTTLVRRHGVDYHIGEDENAVAWWAWKVPIGEETAATKQFFEEPDDDGGYTALAEEIAEWIEEPEPWRSRLVRQLARLTGGRPMVDQGKAFTDVVTGESVHHYTDRLGRDWLATHPWASFRVPRQEPGFNLDERLWGWRRDR